VLKRNKKENRMKNKINIKSLVLSAALGAAVVFSLGAATEHKKSEYRQLPTQLSDDSLNKLAAEGWTVVCTGTSQTGGFYLLTRTKQ
jgi:S-adenosylmethionine:tRNA-ribosyltransferase-isomerase (queuine synthetase)